MEYKILGRTDLKVSAVCLGTMTFGDQVDEVGSVKIIKNALDEGINFFDTANVYAEGRSEEIVGKALKENRKAIIIATKVGAGKGPRENGRPLSSKNIVYNLENSLARLKTEYVDIYYIHFPDHKTPIEETLRAMDDLVRQGKVRYLGCSNFLAYQLCKALWTSQTNNLARFECNEPPYNLLTRDIELELLPLCKEEQVGVCVYNPLAGGMLTGKYSPDKEPPEGTRFSTWKGKMYRDRYWSEANFEVINALKELSSNRSISLPQFSLAWILNNPVITSVICGVTSADHLQANLAAVNIKLTAEELAACDHAWQMLSPPRFMYGR